LIRTLIAIIAGAAITAAITAASITAASITAASITAAAIKVATVPTATVDTARRRNIDSAAGRRRRRKIDLAAAAAPEITAATIRDRTIATGEEAKCFGLGRNGGGSECESCCGHDSYPAEFQHHDTSPVIYFAFTN
jgi:hypothetical protein